jgi:uncharacterized protein DUF6587
MQSLIVAAIVTLALAYAVWHWMPAAYRRKMATWLARAAGRAGLAEHQTQRLADKLGQPAGCSSCDSCGSCSAPNLPQKNMEQQPIRMPERWQKPER